MRKRADRVTAKEVENGQRGEKRKRVERVIHLEREREREREKEREIRNCSQYLKIIFLTKYEFSQKN